MRGSQAKVAVIRRTARNKLGNFGDHRFCRDGVGAATVRRQADTGRGHHPGGGLLAGLAAESR